MKKPIEREPWHWGRVIFGFLVLGSILFVGFLLTVFIGLLSAVMGGGLAPGSGNVAIIPVTGVISTDGAGSLLEEGPVPSHTIVEWIKDAEQNDDVAAIILEINSPGGSPVASDEIAQAVLATQKPTIAVIREVGASGAYWVASAADYIFANRMSITGSIGVRASGLEFGRFLEDHNITYRQTIAGKYKDVGTPLRDSTPEERAMLQNTVDVLHDFFIETVSENRNIPKNKIREIAHGYIILGVDAKRLHLIDDFGGMDDAVAYVEAQENITATTYRYGYYGPLFGLFSAASTHLAQGIGRGIGMSLQRPVFQAPNAEVELIL